MINAELLTAQTKDSAEGDWEALMELYNDLGGDNWNNNSGWGSGSVVTNEWYGVEVDANNRVITLDLAGGPIKGEGVVGGNNLVGSRLTPKLGNLKKVEYVNLKQNKIVDATLPAEISLMTNLKFLYLSGARFLHDDRFGQTSIKANSIDESSNRYVGELPAEWGNLSSIKVLEISWTSNIGSAGNFTGGIAGSLPPEWGKLNTLVGLYIGGNHELVSTLPKEWGGMENLVHLDIGGVQGQKMEGLTGPLPSEWGGANGFPGMRKLATLLISGNFEGTFPDDWENMKMLWRITIANSNFSGEFPSFFSNGNYHKRIVKDNPDPVATPVEAFHSGLSSIEAMFNSFSGPHPDPSNLQWISRWGFALNNFSGEIPSNLADLGSDNGGPIQYDITSNNLSGQIPDLSSWRRLRFINVPGNNLFGSLPDLNTNNSNFRNSQWQNNNFSGAIPESWNFPGSNEIFRLWLHDNDLSGPIPERLADPGHSYSDGFRVDGNRYLFSDLVPFIELGPNNFTYAPQQAFGVARTVSRPAGDRVVIEFPEVSHPDNRYQWVKNGSDISGATSRTLTISSMSDSDQGIYSLRVTNPKAPDLTLTSVEIELVLGDNNSDPDDTSEPQQPDTPSLLNPADNSTDLSVSPLFEWSDVSADTYRLQVSESSDFTNTVSDIENLSGTSSQVDNLNYGSSYFWRVKAVLNGVEGEWSSTNEFSTRSEPVSIPGQPQLLSPESGAAGISRSPSLSWSQVADAASYRVQVSAVQTFDTVINDLSGIGGTGVNISGLDFETEYFWRVQAVNEAGAGGWSATWSFSTVDEPLAVPGVPVLVSPAAGATNVSRSPLLDWDVAANAASYEVQVSTSQEFETLETEESGLFETEYSVSGLEFGTIYYWRVKAVNETGESGWSQTRLFTTLDEPLSAPSSPGLLLPEANSTDVSRSPELSWSEPANAETYRVQISVTSGFGSPVLDLNNVSESVVVAENLNYGTTYFWRVLAENDAGQSSWSGTRSFTTREQPLLPPPAPQLASPQSGSEEISSFNHTFTWNEADRAESYRLQFSNGNSSFSPSIDIENITGVSRTIEGLEPETTYLWRVQAVNGAGSSEWSEIWFFVTDEAAPLPSLPLANSTNVELAPSFTWNSLNADEYILQVNRANTGETVIEESVADTTFTVSSELSPLTVYRWRVKAVTDSLEGDWGPSIAFTTGNPNGNAGDDDDNGDEDDGNGSDDGPVENQDEEITTIEQNYPNPFNPSTVIQFRLAEAQQVSLKIYNLAGQRVATLVSEPLSAGTHSRVFDAAGLASGIYFYRLITERNVFTKKMTLIK